jgi:hypothetical protein
VPSLSLLAQTLREWSANASKPFDYLAVCSDETVAGGDEFVAHTAELGLPVTTDPDLIAAFLRRRGRRVVFATYQSSLQIAAACTSPGYGGRTWMRRTPLAQPLAIGVALVALAAAGCGDDEDGGTSTGERSADAVPAWPAPPDPMQRTVEAGLKPERKEFLIHHVHAHLDVFVEGKPVVVPAGVGIDIDDPRVHRFMEPDGSTSYGGITRPCRKPCILPPAYA